jgi:hypothetical protein
MAAEQKEGFLTENVKFALVTTIIKTNLPEI